jgi:hypothetical protein
MAMGPAPDAATMRIAQSVGFVAAPPLRFLFKLLTLRPLATRLPFGSIVGPLLARASRRPLRRVGRLRPPPTPSVRIEEMRSFGPAFDALWSTVTRQTAVSVHRDHDTMNWRYRDNPFQHYRALGAWSGDALVGCLVFKVVHHDAFTYATIAEIVIPGAMGAVLETLLARVFEELASEGVDIVKTLASVPDHVDALHRAGFRAVGPGCAFVIAVAPALKAVFGRHLDPQGWHLTKGDADLDMVPDFMTYLPS